MQQSGIEFNSYKDKGGINIATRPIKVSGIQGPNEFGGIINAVDVDWNGAELIRRGFANAA